MDRRLIVSILFLLTIGTLRQVNGSADYKWVPLKSGDTLPDNTVSFENRLEVFVGRARHFDEILPAEISANGSAVISSCNVEIPKKQFEILTTTKKCEWKHMYDVTNIDDTVIRGGTAWNGEPIYIGASAYANDNFRYYSSDSVYHITSIYLNRNYIYNWFSREYNQWQYLSCDSKNEWIDSSSMQLPKNTISGGESEDDYDIYVARLKRNCDVITGQVIPQIGTAMAVLNDGTAIEASYCQVLVGETNEYAWVSASDGEIPDFAVSNGKIGNELAYIARINKTITYLTYSKAFRDHLDYDILVKN